MPLARATLGAIAAGEDAFEERLLAAAAERHGLDLRTLAATRRADRELATPRPIAEDPRSPRGNLPTGDIAATKERRQ